MKRLLPLIVLLLLTGCAGSTVSGNAQTGLSATATPAEVWTTSIQDTDSQGFRFSVRARPVAFTPSPAGGVNTVAPPGYDFLDVEVQVTNLLTDRRGPFTENDVEIEDYPASGPQSSEPCTDTLCGFGWIADGGPLTGVGALTQTLDVPAGASSSFHLYREFPQTLRITDLVFSIGYCAAPCNEGSHLPPLPGH
jgi:hypothetical protein